MKKKILSCILTAIMTCSFAPLNAINSAAYGIEVMNFDYEEDTFFSAVGNASVERVSSESRSGDYALLISNRTLASDGASLMMESKGEATYYDVTVWVKAVESCKVTVTLGGEKANSANLLADSWTKISGRVYIENDDALLELKINGESGTSDLYIDDISVLAEGQDITTPYYPEGVNMLDGSDFETGVLGNALERSSTCTVQESSAYEGRYGACVSNRDAGWEGIEYEIKDLIIKNTTYKVSAWVRLEDSSTESATISAQLEISEPGYDTRYSGVASAQAKNGEWVQISGVFSTEGIVMPANSVKLYFSSGDDNICDFSIDSVTLAYTTDSISSGSSRPADANPWVDETLTPLKDVYKDYWLMGVARSSDVGEISKVEDDMIEKHFDIMTPGNATKPDALEAKKGVFTWSTADYMVDEAIDRGVLVHGHVFVWHEQSPDWMNADGMSREEALQNMEEYIKTVAEHFEGKMYSWDVVNEAIDNITDVNSVSGILRDTPWRRAIGDDYIEQAFILADKYLGPDVKLYYNDYNLDDATKADAVCTLVKELQSKGIRIDGIGMQGHYNTTTSVAAVEASIEKFEALGVEISVTELDVCHYGMEQSYVMTEQEEIEQAQKYAQLFKMYKKHADSIDRITIWGIDDGTSWRSENCPVLFDKDYQPKEAYYALLDPEGYLEEHPVTGKLMNRATAMYGTPEIDGEAEDAWSVCEEYNINKYVMAWQGATATVKAMWDEEYLYLLFDVTDPLLSDVGSDAYLQDSVETFLDENNAKSSSYQSDDSHYRVNFNNIASFDAGCNEEKFKSATQITDTGYIVELAIPFWLEHSVGDILGFDAQVNDDSNGDGNRTSVTKFNDVSDNSWSNTENFGEIYLTEDGQLPDMFVVYNGRTLQFDVQPCMINDRTMVPFRTIFETFGATVEYDETTQKITATKDETTIELQIDSNEAMVNGETTTLDVAPIVVDGRTLVPVRFISEAMDADVAWSESSKTVTITY